MEETKGREEQIGLFGEEQESDSRVLTVLHAGDVLLDAPVRRLRRDTKERRREELRRAFSAFLSRVDEEKADLVLFSGNLIDKTYAGDETLRFLASAFEARPHTHFLISPGPKDSLGEHSIYLSRRLPRNVHVFNEELMGVYSSPALPVTVYGWAYRDGECRHAPLGRARRQGADRFHILCGYTALTADGAAAPMTEEAIAAFGAQYAAFSGRVHDGFRRAGDCVYAYSGVFEGRDFAEGETGGYVRIRARECAGGWRVEAERVELDTYHYAFDRLDVSHLTDASQAEERLASLVRERGYGERTVLRLALCGSVPLTADFRAFDGGATFGLYSLWIEDRTVPTDASERLLQQMNAAGELYRHFYPQMTEGPEEDRVRAARAFRIGYAALMNEDFTKL